MSAKNSHIQKLFQSETVNLNPGIQAKMIYSDRRAIGGFMKNLLLVLTLALVLPATFASAEVVKDDSGGSYVPFQDFKITFTDSLFEMFAGKFEEVKNSYCISNAKQACRKQLIMQTCKMNVNQAAGSCPDACRSWAKDCEKTPSSELRKRFGDDLED